MPLEYDEKKREHVELSDGFSFGKVINTKEKEDEIMIKGELKIIKTPNSNNDFTFSEKHISDDWANTNVKIKDFKEEKGFTNDVIIVLTTSSKKFVDQEIERVGFILDDIIEKIKSNL